MAIRKATDADMDAIRQWLHETDSTGLRESLVANWNITWEVHADKGVYVFIDEETNEPVAYFWGSLHTTSSILDVKPSHRKRGVGKKIVEYFIKDATRKNEPLLKIHCCPESSEPFWNCMGFETHLRGNKIYGTRILDIPANLPEEGKAIDVRILFADDSGIRGKAAPFSEHHLIGILDDEDGQIYLPKTIAYYSPNAFGDFGELCVRITVGSGEDSKIIVSDRCKYDKAFEAGVESCLNGYRINGIVMV